ncbi:MAG: hypothetical protein CMH28_00395, partial [Micavibrio sp.]|nr:hypothetical protein [Micavibrio sp.]
PLLDKIFTIKSLIIASGANEPLSIRDLILLPKSEFFEAEEYHQDYYKKNAMQYKLYKWNCGRDQELEGIWQE